MYKLSKPINGVTRVIFFELDNIHMSIPLDPSNSDYQAYLKWLEEGNTPLPADEPTQE
jgi:hypothetical protein